MGRQGSAGDERSQFYLHHEKLPFEIQQLIADKLGDDGWARVSDNFANYYMTLLANAIAIMSIVALVKIHYFKAKNCQET